MRICILLLITNIKAHMSVSLDLEINKCTLNKEKYAKTKYGIKYRNKEIKYSPVNLAYKFIYFLITDFTYKVQMLVCRIQYETLFH